MCYLDHWVTLFSRKVLFVRQTNSPNIFLKWYKPSNQHIPVNDLKAHTVYITLSVQAHQLIPFKLIPANHNSFYGMNIVDYLMK